MFAASRVASTFRTVIPYAQWAYIVVQMGYVGYNLFQLYQSYRVQAESDLRDGIDRSLEETIELVIKPVRRRQKSPNTTIEEINEAAVDEGDQVKSQIVAIDNEKSTYIAVDSSQCLPGTSTQSQDQEVRIIYDSRDETNAVMTSKLQQKCDETLSNASTSIESTDSNNGIVKNMYTECFICTRSLNNPDKPVATLPFCMHPFHQTCLDSVLKWHPKCPVCDFHIFSPI